MCVSVRISFGVFLVFLLVCPLAASALELPACSPSTEICGDGIDQDCDGSDALCPAPDTDRDGYADSVDCDDANRQVYPGVSVACGGEGCTQTCQGNGSYSACSCTPLCEATGSGSCYYISAERGSDSNPGTYAQPWKTQLKVVSYYSGDDAPSGAVSLSAGDVVYFLSGKYRTNYTYYNTRETLFFRFVNGTSTNPIVLKAYPGQRAVIWPLEKTKGISIYQSSHIIVDGLEVIGAWDAGIKADEASSIEIRNAWVHETDGPDNDNIAGVHMVGVNGVSIHHSRVHDNYDRENADTGGNATENSRNIVLFSGGNARINHNVIFQTPPISSPKTGGCVTYKHSADVVGSIFEVDHNMFKNCRFVSVGSGSYGTRIHHNLISDSDPIAVRDFGGTTHNRDIIIEKNTIVGTNGFDYTPTDEWGSIGLVTFRNNIIVDSSSYYFERGMITIGTYSSDSIYNQTVSAGNLAFSGNCYYNASYTPSWALFARNGGSYGSLGDEYNFSGWQGLGFDGGSLVSNPQLDTYFAPQNSSCQDAGWLAE